MGSKPTERICTCIPKGQESHCPYCCLNFSSDSAFDTHARGDHEPPATAVKPKKGTPVFKLLHRTNPDREVWTLTKSQEAQEFVAARNSEKSG